MLPKQLKDSQGHQRQPKQVELFLQRKTYLSGARWSSELVSSWYTTRHGICGGPVSPILRKSRARTLGSCKMSGEIFEGNNGFEIDLQWW